MGGGTAAKMKGQGELGQGQGCPDHLEAKFCSLECGNDYRGHPCVGGGGWLLGLRLSLGLAELCECVLGGVLSVCVCVCLCVSVCYVHVCASVRVHVCV